MALPKVYARKDSFVSFRMCMDWRREDTPPNDVTERIRAVFCIGLEIRASSPGMPFVISIKQAAIFIGSKSWE